MLFTFRFRDTISKHAEELFFTSAAQQLEHTTCTHSAKPRRVRRVSSSNQDSDLENRVTIRIAITVEDNETKRIFEKHI